MLRQRVITALILIALLLPTLAADSPLPFALFALLLATGGMWEWARLSGLSPVACLGCAGLFAAAAGAALTQGVLGVQAGVVWSAVTVAWIVVCALLFPVGPTAWKGAGRGVRLLAGLCVMGSTWLALAQARSMGLNFLLSVMCLVWASDISAYFAGVRWGRRKLAPTLSPGKSWEGVAGAVVGVVLLASGWMLVERALGLDSPSVYRLTLQSFGVAGLVFVVALLVALGVAGDLFESLMKRAVGIKDSSGLLPGHGGVLDRVDALMPVLPAAMAVQWLARGGT